MNVLQKHRRSLSSETFCRHHVMIMIITRKTSRTHFCPPGGISRTQEVLICTRTQASQRYLYLGLGIHVYPFQSHQCTRLRYHSAKKCKPTTGSSASKRSHLKKLSKSTCHSSNRKRFKYTVDGFTCILLTPVTGSLKHASPIMR